jgi:glycosyltransferase involved in cell wall biosynthesis
MQKKPNFYSSDRPEIAHITNHGYAGPEIPIGGAPDTGGQIYYVNTLSRKLENMGYKVTIFSRGGFPYYESTRIRTKIEFLSPHVRYVYIPGGGETFIRKEDIAIALDEELNWIYRFINKEGEKKNCNPWEVYEFINSHYWDAAVLVISLIERWRNDMVSVSLNRLLEGIVPQKDLQEMHENRHWMAIGEMPSLHLGQLLLNQESLKNHDISQQIRSASSCWARGKALGVNEENILVDYAEEALPPLKTTFEPEFQKLVAAGALGQSILMLSPDVDETLKRNLDSIDRHVWTPHSLGELKDFNYRKRPLDIRRNLKFCERRNHERMICSRTHAFVATSTKIAEYLWLNYRVPIEQTFYFPPCVDRTIFKPYTQDELTKTYRYLSRISKLPVNTLRKSRIIFETSRMDRTKRKDLLISAFSKIIQDYDDILLFIGGGPENELFQIFNDSILSSESLHGRAFMTGPIPEEHIGHMFSLAEIYATGSEMEGYGMCVSQAASAGTPIACSDVIPYSLYHVPEYVEIFPVGNSSAFAQVLRKLLDDDALRIKYSKKLIEKAKMLDWELKSKEFIGYLGKKGIIISEKEMK